MSYTEVHEPLRFEGIHVAVLTGDNGHGKSALLDAITWALWGRARARSVDELIHSGASDMEVEFEFLLDEHQYRVIRKRQRRGKSGYSDLQFAVLADEGYRPLTERSLGETERLIERTLRMSYETFTNSSFIQQGRADSFTTNSPAERKRVLAEILELGYYDELEARAKERFKDCEARLADERRLAQEWEVEINRRPEYQTELDRLKGELALLDERHGAVDAQCQLLRERVAALEAIQQQVEEIDSRLQRLAVEHTRVTATLGERRALLGQAAEVIARAAEIERGAAELDAVRHDLERANELQQQYLPLERAREVAMRTVMAEQARLEGEVVQRERRLAELRPLAGRIAELETTLRAAQSEVKKLSAREREQAELQATVTAFREQAAEKRAINAQLKKEMLELRGRIEELEQLSTCPTCRRPMDVAHKQRLQREYSQQGARLRDEFRSHESTCRELDTAISRSDAQLGQVSQQLVSRDRVQRHA